MTITLRSDIDVRLIDSMASDISVTRAAQVSVKGENNPETDTPRLINYLMESRHGCYDAQTEILTAQGWKPFPEYVKNPLPVWTLNLDTGRQELQSPVRVVDEPYSGEMVRVLAQEVDLLVTPNHKMVAQRRVSGGWTPLELVDADTLSQRSHRLHLVGGVRDGEVTLTPDEEELLGFIIADGNVHQGSITFHLRKERKIKWLRDRADIRQDGDVYKIENPSEQLLKYAASTYDTSTKDRRVPTRVLVDWPSDSVYRMLMGYLEGDGHRTATNKVSATTVSEGLVNDLMEAGLAAGVAVQKSFVNTKRESAFGSRPIYTLAFVSDRRSRPRIGWTQEARTREVTKVPYEGRVYCATVPNGTLYVRRNGKSLWCGNSPFEHAVFTFFVSAPIFVFREWHRHRIASINEMSGRYTKLKPVFYVPAPDRKLVNVGTSARPEFAPGTDEQMSVVQSFVRETAEQSWDQYEQLLEMGVANEVARSVLPVNIYSEMYWTVNARALMNFLSLRIDHPNSAVRSRPQWEIQMGAEVMEQIFAEKMPHTHAAFTKHGRVAP